MDAGLGCRRRESDERSEHRGRRPDGQGRTGPVPGWTGRELGQRVPAPIETAHCVCYVGHAVDSPDSLLQTALPQGLLLSIWIAFWIALFLLGVQDYVWSAGHQLWEPALEYGAAALVSTAIGIVQLRRARLIDRERVRPLTWLSQLWKWMPVEIVAFALVMLAAHHATTLLGGTVLEASAMVEQMVYDTGKFLLFYVLAGAVQFAFHAYGAWTSERWGRWCSTRRRMTVSPPSIWRSIPCGPADCRRPC